MSIGIIIGQIPVPDPKDLPSWTSDTAMIFLAIFGFITLAGMAGFFARENSKMLNVVQDMDDKREVSSKRWRAFHRKQTERVLKEITDKMDARHTDLVKTIMTALTGDPKGGKRTGDTAGK